MKDPSLLSVLAHKYISSTSNDIKKKIFILIYTFKTIVKQLKSLQYRK